MVLFLLRELEMNGFIEELDWEGRQSLLVVMLPLKLY